MILFYKAITNPKTPAPAAAKPPTTLKPVGAAPALLDEVFFVVDATSAVVEAPVEADVEPVDVDRKDDVETVEFEWEDVTMVPVE